MELDKGSEVPDEIPDEAAEEQPDGSEAVMHDETPSEEMPAKPFMNSEETGTGDDEPEEIKADPEQESSPNQEPPQSSDAIEDDESVEAESEITAEEDGVGRAVSSWINRVPGTAGQGREVNMEAQKATDETPEPGHDSLYDKPPSTHMSGSHHVHHKFLNMDYEGSGNAMLPHVIWGLLLLCSVLIGGYLHISSSEILSELEAPHSAGTPAEANANPEKKTESVLQLEERRRKSSELERQNADLAARIKILELDLEFQFKESQKTPTPATKTVSKSEVEKWRQKSVEMEKENTDLAARISQLKRDLEIKLQENTELEALQQSQPLSGSPEPAPQEQADAAAMTVRQVAFPIQKSNNCCYCSCQEGQ